MAVKAFVSYYENGPGLQGSFTYDLGLWDESTDTYIGMWPQNFITMSVDIVQPYTPIKIYNATVASAVAVSLTNGYTVSPSNVIIFGNPQIPATITRTFNNTPSRSIVTGTGATGFQVSATQDADVQYSPTMVTTASISGNASDVLVFEICSTNSATAGNWIEIGRLSNAQALTLAITLQSVQTTSGLLGGIIPAGYYAKIRATTSGTVTNTFVSGQEVLL